MDARVELVLLSERELRDDPHPEWPFRLIFRELFQRQPGGSVTREPLAVRLSPDVLADLIAQGRAHQQSYALRVLRQGREQQAAAEAFAPADPHAGRHPDLLRRILAGLRALPDSVEGNASVA